MTTVLTADGQIAIPQELRDALGLDAGQSLELRTQGDLLVAWKTPSPGVSDVFDKWRGRGHAPAGDNSDETLRLIRDGDGR